MSSHVLKLTLNCPTAVLHNSYNYLFFPGTLWYILAVMTSEDASMHKTVMLFEFMLGPSFVLNNLYRCFTIFLFLAIAMILKTIFTIGVTDTMHYFTVCYFWKINLKSQI